MEKNYQVMLEYIRQRPTLEKTILFITKYIPYMTVCLYLCLLTYLFIINDSLLIETIWKPLGAFLTVTIIRKIVNRPRPYETLNITPLKSHKKGESFPSRHCVSSMIIALVCFPIHLVLGITALIMAIVMSICRVLAGVHYISDIIVSMIIAIIFYLI